MTSIKDGILVACGVMIFAMFFYGVGPIIETKFFPVYSRFKIISLERIPPNRSLLKAEYVKYRSCQPIGSAWYNSPVSRDVEGGTARQLEWLPRRIIGPTPMNRPVGKAISLPFELDASPEEITSTVFAEIYSNCHPFWVTKSLIYP